MTYYCPECEISYPINLKTLHIRRKHPELSDDLAKMIILAKKCTKLYWGIINNLIEIENLETSIAELHPYQNLQNKSWHKAFIASRTAFFKSLKNISNNP